MQTQGNRANAWRMILAATLLVAITLGARNTLGLFLSPINTATGLGLASISLAWALSQLVWGACQPLAGLLSERFGAARVIAAGAVVLTLSTAALPLAASTAGLTLVLGAISAAGTAVGGVPMLLGTVAQRVGPQWRPIASGVVGAGGSGGQLLLAPAVQAGISGAGWIPAVLGLALLSLAALPIAATFRERRRAPRETASNARPTPEPETGPGLRTALRSPTYWLLTAGFAACGFHVGFLFAHMPNVIALCGLPAATSGLWLALLGVCNIFGSVASGMFVRRASMTRTLSAIYALRALGVVAFLALPKTTESLLLFASWMGLTYFAVIPPTSGLIATLVNARQFATLFGVTMFVHQLGSFLGVWFGGLAAEKLGSYELVWQIDIGFALFSAVVHLLVRDPSARPRIVKSARAPAPPPRQSMALARL
ncbi:MAG: MFS transporter [Betaproteobacteria bacterium]|jgi:MFS family permease|nr:MFS transporter [Betaproteobacteria bacterium]